MYSNVQDSKFRKNYIILKQDLLNSKSWEKFMKFNLAIMNPSNLRIEYAHEDVKSYGKWRWSKNNKFVILNMICQIFVVVNVWSCAWYIK